MEVAMRYVETSQGILLSPRQHAGHRDMLCRAGLSESEVLSAGFMAARYEAAKTWQSFGSSQSLQLKSRPVTVSEQLWVGHSEGRLLYSDNPALLAGLEDVVQAVWGMSDEGEEGTCAVYAPLHPRVSLSADVVVLDY